MVLESPLQVPAGRRADPSVPSEEAPGSNNKEYMQAGAGAEAMSVGEEWE